MSATRPVALVIGMGPGLSAALAQRFAAGGYAIAGLARSPEKSAALAAEMAERGQKLDLRAVDAGDFIAIGSAVRAVEAQLGPIEVLIYNAYSATPAVPSQIPLDALVADFRVNVGGALAAVQAALPAMQARGKGTVLLTGGGLALIPPAGSRPPRSPSARPGSATLPKACTRKWTARPSASAPSPSPARSSPAHRWRPKQSPSASGTCMRCPHLRQWK